MSASLPSLASSHPPYAPSPTPPDSDPSPSCSPPRALDLHLSDHDDSAHAQQFTDLVAAAAAAAATTAVTTPSKKPLSTPPTKLQMKFQGLSLLYADTAPAATWKPQVDPWMKRNHPAQLKDIARTASPPPVYNSLESHWSFAITKARQALELDAIKGQSESLLANYKSSGLLDPNPLGSSLGAGRDLVIQANNARLGSGGPSLSRSPSDLPIVHQQHHLDHHRHYNNSHPRPYPGESALIEDDDDDEYSNQENANAPIYSNNPRSLTTPSTALHPKGLSASAARRKSAADAAHHKPPSSSSSAFSSSKRFPPQNSKPRTKSLSAAQTNSSSLNNIPPSASLGSSGSAPVAPPAGISKNSGQRRRSSTNAPYVKAGDYAAKVVAATTAAAAAAASSNPLSQSGTYLMPNPNGLPPGTSPLRSKSSSPTLIPNGAGPLANAPYPMAVSPAEQSSFMGSTGNNYDQMLARQNANPNAAMPYQPPSPPSSPNSFSAQKNGSSATGPQAPAPTSQQQQRGYSTVPSSQTLTFHSKRRCISCGSDQSPCWRPSWSPAAGQLCNSCGLRYKKTNARCLNKACGRIPAKCEWASIKNEAVRDENGQIHYRCTSCKGEIEVKKT